MSKKMLSIEDIEGQTALALPERKMMALVNVILIDVVSGNQVNVQVPIGVAANICGINAAVLAQAEQTTNPVCTATVDQRTFARLTR